MAELNAHLDPFLPVLMSKYLTAEELGNMVMDTDVDVGHGLLDHLDHSDLFPAAGIMNQSSSLKPPMSPPDSISSYTGSTISDEDLNSRMGVGSLGLGCLLPEGGKDDQGLLNIPAYNLWAMNQSAANNMMGFAAAQQQQQQQNLLSQMANMANLNAMAANMLGSSMGLLHQAGSPQISALAAAGSPSPAVKPEPRASPAPSVPFQAGSPVAAVVAAAAAAAAAAPPGKATKPKCDRKIAHNAVERRYRNSINSRIDELKMILSNSESVADDSKLNKSAVLKKAIDCIIALRRVNQDLMDNNRMLKEEVEGLRTQVKQLGGSPIQVLSEIKPMDCRPAPHTSPISPQDDTGIESDSSCSSQGSSTYAKSSASSAGPFKLHPVPSSSSSPYISDGSRVFLFVLLFTFGFFNFSFVSQGSSSSGEGALGGSAAAHPGARVLSSVDGASADAPATWTDWLAAFSSFLWYWSVRAAMLLACAVFMFMREPVTSNDSAVARAAQEHQKKSATLSAVGNTRVAKWHAIEALVCLGRPLPASSIEMALALSWQVCRQILHSMYVGLWLDRVFADRTANTRASAATAALVNHQLHQLLLAEADAKPDEIFGRTTLSALNALNLAESVSSSMDPLALARIYISTAAQTHLVSNAQSALLSRYFLWCAQPAFHACADRASGLSWIFQPEGHQFFLNGSWVEQRLVGADGTKLAVGSIEHLGLAFRLQLLERAMSEFVKGGDAEVLAQRLLDVRQYSQQAADAQTEWWALMALVVVHWRQGKTADARAMIIAADKLKVFRGRLQDAIYASSRAHQALLDGDHALCWSACQRASLLLQGEAEAEAASGISATLLQAGKYIAFRQLLSARVALYRLRTYLSSVPGAALPAMPEDVTFRTMLKNAQDDVQLLRMFSDQYVFAEPLVHLYQAICRALAGGRLGPTELLFEQGLKASKRLNLPFDEALIRLHMCTYLRTSLTPAALRQHLNTAAETFQQLEALDELSSCRKLLKIVGSEN